MVDALIAADKADIALSLNRAVAINLARRNVLEAVKVLVSPQVIQTPEVSAVAKDGIELIFSARVTIRANPEVEQVRKPSWHGSAKASWIVLQLTCMSLSQPSSSAIPKLGG